MIGGLRAVCLFEDSWLNLVHSFDAGVIRSSCNRLLLVVAAQHDVHARSDQEEERRRSAEWRGDPNLHPLRHRRNNRGMSDRYDCFPLQSNTSPGRDSASLLRGVVDSFIHSFNNFLIVL